MNFVAHAASVSWSTRICQTAYMRCNCLPKGYLVAQPFYIRFNQKRSHYETVNLGVSSFSHAHSTRLAGFGPDESSHQLDRSHGSPKRHVYGSTGGTV